jgi:hypothetical protein
LINNFGYITRILSSKRSIFKYVEF